MVDSDVLKFYLFLLQYTFHASNIRASLVN